ncbi:hypothetical protein THAOC_35065, partial [Thalassiosira oceanica]
HAVVPWSVPAGSAVAEVRVPLEQDRRVAHEEERAEDGQAEDSPADYGHVVDHCLAFFCAPEAGLLLTILPNLALPLSVSSTALPRTTQGLMFKRYKPLGPPFPRPL